MQDTSLRGKRGLSGPAGPAIALTGVNLSLGRGAARVHILKDIDLHIGAVEAIGLVGPSGSGKSTLLMVMAGLERADTGTVVVAGEALGSLGEDALARFRGRHVGIVFQSFHLIPTMTALENIAVPLELAGIAEAHERAARELAAVGLAERRDHYPAQLSGGEQQRVALARALAPNPAILIADEPTGNLDETTGSEIIDLLFAGHAERNTTLVLVTHDTALARRCDRVVRLRSGEDRDRAAARGTTRMSAPAVRDSGRDRPSQLALPLRFALRELRGGLRGFYVFIACIALGVMAIAGVGAVASGLADGLAREGRTILGGDLSFSLSLREADKEERAFIESHGRLSLAATMRAMARTQDGRTALTEVKAVDAAYPLYGTVVLDPPQPLASALAHRDGAFGAAADPALLARLDLKPGDRITVGAAPIEIRAALTSEPDKLASGIGFGPRLLISEEALRTTGLLQPGSVVRWHYRLRLPGNDATDQAVKAVAAAAEKQLPEAGWEIRSRTSASPAVAQNVERFTQYLTLVGLTALLVGGVGVANAVRSHLDRRRDVIATFKSLGATCGMVFAIYLTQVLVLALIGALPGLAAGAALPFLIAWGFGAVLPLPLAPAIHIGGLALALLYGVLTAVAFALWPLGRAHDVPVSALFRDTVAGVDRWPRRSYVVATALVATALAGIAIALAFDRRIAVIFVVAAAAVFVLLRLVAVLLMALARRAPRLRSPVARLAIANIHRPGALTPSIVLSLGLGLALLVTVIEIDGNLRKQFMAALPGKAPSFYFIDIPAADAEKFDAFVHARAPGATLDRVPMLRGRILAAHGVPADQLKPTPDTAWALQSDRGITYGDGIPAGSRVVAGEWWKPGYQGPPLVSFEKKIADSIGLKVGDTVTVNVLGRNMTATVANLRTLDWQSLGINFVMVFSPNSFRGAPHTHIATLAYPRDGPPGDEIALLKAVADAFPTVTTVRVREALDAVANIVNNLVLAIRGASALTLLVAVLVLGGALAAGHRHRVYDAVILKTVGATRGRLLSAYALEYLTLGLATAVFGVTAGMASAAYVVSKVMNLSFTLLPGPALAAAAIAVLATLVLGLAGTFAALGQKPAPVLRNL